MKKAQFILSALIAFLCFSCQKEEVSAPEQSFTRLEATVDTQNSRVAFDPEGMFYWTNGDCIGVIMPSLSPTSFQAMNLQNGAGTGSASFISTETADLGEYAVYPFDSSHQFNETKDSLSFLLPKSITRHSCDVQTNFHEGEKSETPSFNAPMYGKIDGNKVMFKHLGGVLCLKVAGLVPGSQFIEIKADQRLSGFFPVKLNAETPIMVTQPGSDNVRICFINNSNMDTGIFYVPVPTGTFNNLTVNLLNVEGKVILKKNFGTVVIERCDLRILRNSVVVSTISDANKALDKGETILNITGTDNESVLQIPTTDENNTLILNYTGASQKIAIAAKEGNTSSQKLKILLNGKQSGELNIDLPNASVQLGTSAPVNFGTASVATAENTFEVGQGIKIDKLTIKGGSVILHRGAKIGTLEKDTLVKDFVCYLYVENGADIDESKIPAGITLVKGDNCVILTKKEPVITPVTANIEMLFAQLILPDSYGEYGICYSDSATNEGPKISDGKVSYEYFKEPGGGKDPGKGGGESSDQVKLSTFTLKGLTPKKTYYYRPYCIIRGFDKSEKIVYGSEVKKLDTPDVVLSTDEYVDLGLSVYWATRNLEATNLEDEGGNYYWGAKTVSKAGDYVDVTDNTIYDEKRILKPENDAAYLKLGGNWRMPTNDEMSELKRCVFADYTLNGKQGCVVMGPNGNFIFLPKKHYNKEEINGWDDPESPNKGEWYLSYWTSERMSGNHYTSREQAYCLVDLWIKQEGGSGTYKYVNGLTEYYVSWKRNALYNIRPVCSK